MSEIMWLLVEIMINVYQGFLTTIFLNRTLTAKRTLILPSILNTVLFALACCTYLVWDLPIADTWMFIFPAIYAFVFFRDSWKAKLLWSAILVAIFNGVVSLCLSLFTSVFKIDTAVLIEPTMMRLVFVGTTNIALLAAIIIVSGRKYHGLNHFPSIVLFVIVNGLVVLIVDSLFLILENGADSSKQILVTAAMTLGISVASILLYEIMASYVTKYYEAKTAEEQEVLRLRRMDELRSIYSSLNSLRHDLKNHLQIATMMIKNGKQQESTDYLYQIEHQLFTVFSSGSVALDSELTMKELAMRKSNIIFDYRLCALDSLPISEFELCAVIGNLLDNAIEAVERLDQHTECSEKPTISLYFSRVRKMLCIRCMNPASSRSVRKIGDHYVTSKCENGHGLGISNIKSIVQKANGVASFKYENGYFVVDISLPYL